MSVSRLVVGLGNPDPEHARTRHNLGWMVADELARRGGAGWTEAKRLSGTVARRGDAVLLKPTTYMNASGRAVGAALRYYRLPAERLLVIADDINLPFGELRYRDAGSAGGQKGLADVIRVLGTEAVPRLRVGIGGPDGADATPHVLGTFSAAEAEHVPKIIAAATDRAEEWLDG